LAVATEKKDRIPDSLDRAADRRDHLAAKQCDDALRREVTKTRTTFLDDGDRGGIHFHPIRVPLQEQQEQQE
jgi:hypothetical protein